MSKRTFDAAIEDLLAISDYENARGDIVSGNEARQLADAVREIENHYLTIKNNHKVKRLGRNSRAVERDNTRAIKLYCYLEPSDMITNLEAKTLTEAFERIAQHGIPIETESGEKLFKVEYETVRQYYHAQPNKPRISALKPPRAKRKSGARKT
jgi:hypothetical protein